LRKSNYFHKPVGFGRELHVLLEEVNKVGQLVEAQAPGDFAHRPVGVFEQPLPMYDPVITTSSLFPMAVPGITRRLSQVLLAAVIKAIKPSRPLYTPP
jgi:hypothetical protein